MSLAIQGTICKFLKVFHGLLDLLNAGNMYTKQDTQRTAPELYEDKLKGDFCFLDTFA
jgi:hypothetical protein